MTLEIQNLTFGARGLRFPSQAWPWLALAAVGALAFYWDGIRSLGSAWTRPEYSYGPLVPFVTAYITLRELHHHPVGAATGSKLPGLSVVTFGLLVGLLGNLAKIPDIVTYGLIILIGGLILIVAGTKQGLRFWPAWFHLVFMLPLPQILYLHVSTKLQHISSQLGVAFTEAVNIPVLLDGNIIDLGVYQLQVAEACSGLRYLFPLLSFGWLIAVLYNGPFWHRVFLFLSTIPITIFMNSFRIAVISVLVSEYGIAQAEGFLHFFEGWIIFITCTVMLYLEAFLLHRFGTNRPRASGVLSIDITGILAPLRELKMVPSSTPLAAAGILTLCFGVIWQVLPSPSSHDVARRSLETFPLQLAEWRGNSGLLDSATARVLGADEYMLANYVSGKEAIGLLLTFYKSQTEGSGIHSPEVCLPSGGWEVSDWAQKSISIGSKPIIVNRALIRKGLDRQLVYYWFEQRGHRTTSDHEAKFLTIWDTITEGRSDGGLVRLTTPLNSTEQVETGDVRLSRFMKILVPRLPEYFPPLGR